MDTCMPLLACAAGATMAPYVGFWFPDFSACAMLHNEGLWTNVDNKPHMWISTARDDKLWPPAKLAPAVAALKVGTLRCLPLCGQ